MTDPDAPTTSNSASNSASQFRVEFQREQWKLINDARQSLADLHQRITRMDERQQQMHEDIVELREKAEAHHKHDVDIAELQFWRDTMKEPFDAATRLSQATSGAKMIMLVIFSIASGVLAVAGVLQLASGFWKNLWQ